MGRSGLPSLTCGATRHKLPPAGDGRNRDDRIDMAAVLRGARAGRGGRGRGQGRRRAPAEELQPVPQVQDRVTPVHHQWSLWCDGNQNTIKLVDNDELKAYRRLEESACIDRLELDIFAIPDELLGQQPHIVRMLYDLVDYYNNMMRIRRKYLVKKLDGCWSKEMKQMLKTHDKSLMLSQKYTSDSRCFLCIRMKLLL
ncbi:hypothetical protein ZWY2020_023901 [Hordeum vulgare]|nr:hypothetical protein ZWY2020_023901 [Hordeum vulgare]